MSIRKEIVIKDSCTIIDHCELKLLDAFFSLDLSVYTTPNVVAEITEPDQAAQVQKYIQSGHLKIDGNADVGVVASIVTENTALSPADGSVLELAIRLDATVLTSDGSLRKVTQAKGVKVRGSIWIIEELVVRGHIDKKTALQKLEEYTSINTRAPKKEIATLIEKLNQ